MQLRERLVSANRDKGPDSAAALLTDSTWLLVMDSVAHGETAWLPLGAALLRASDAGNSEGLLIAFAEALPKEPAAVLSLKVPQVCTMPFIEWSGTALTEYRNAALAALAAVADPGLTTEREACRSDLMAASVDTVAS